MLHNHRIYGQQRPIVFSPHRETFIEREPGESANDRNDRAIRVAAQWYGGHLGKAPEGAGLKVVLLTNDRGNKEKAEESGLLTYRCKEQPQSLADET